MQYPSMLPMSCQVRVLSLAPTHFVQLPCFFMAMAFTCWVSSSALRISLCTMFCRSFGSAFFQLVLVEQPSPSVPWATIPTMSAWCSRFSAFVSALLADHLRPILTVKSFSSLLSRSIMACRVFVTLNSSTIDVTGSCTLLPVLYRSVELKLFRTPNHLLR